MPLVRKNADNIDVFSTYFYKRKEPNVAWFHAVGAFQMLTGLRGFWPMSAFDENGDVLDLSGNGQVLAASASPDYKNVDLIPCVDLTRASSQYFSKTDVTFDLTGSEAFVASANQGMTMGGWYRFDATGNLEGLISKWTETADQRSYRLMKDAANTVTFQISTNGQAAGIAGVTSSGTVSSGQWYFIVGRFDRSAEFSVWINSSLTDSATVVGSAFVSNAVFQLGATNTANYHGGEESLVFLCGAYLPDYTIAMLYEHTRALFGV